MFFEIVAIKNFAIFTRKHLCRSLFNKVAGQVKACNFIKKTPRQVFSCEYWTIFKKRFFCRIIPSAASENFLFFQGVHKSNIGKKYVEPGWLRPFLTLKAPTPQSGQTHSNNSSAICRLTG